MTSGAGYDFNGVAGYILAQLEFANGIDDAFE